MEKGHSFLEVIFVSAIICITAFSGLEILLKASNLKNKASLILFLNSSAIEKIEEIKGTLKRGEKISNFSDHLRDPITNTMVFREWGLIEKENLIEIKVIAYTKKRKIELFDSFWKKGGF